MFKFQFLLTQINICIFFILTYKRINECSIVFVVKIFFLQFNDSFTRYIFCYISCFILSYRVLLVCFRSQCYSYSCCICHKPVTLNSFQETRIRLQQKNRRYPSSSYGDLDQNQREDCSIQHFIVRFCSHVINAQTGHGVLHCQGIIKRC